MPEELIATSHADGRVTVQAFPPEIAITAELLGSADPKRLEHCIHFNFDNGYAEYHLFEWNPELGVFKGKLVVASGA